LGILKEKNVQAAVLLKAMLRVESKCVPVRQVYIE